MEFTKSEIVQIDFVIESGGENLLFMRICKDGRVNRKGNGTFHGKNLVATGMTDGRIFRMLIDLFHERVFDHAGVYDSIEKPGTPVTYKIVFKGKPPELKVIEFRTGTETKQFPVILKYVIGYINAAIQWTEHWYQQAVWQTSHVTPNIYYTTASLQRKPWWFFGKLIR